jgi:ankyrin repeat protein
VLLVYLAHFKLHIDECEEGARRELLKRFRSLQRDNSISNRIKIIITSRPHVELNLSDTVIITLDSNNLKEDITDFVTTEVSELTQYSVALQEEIRHALINGADGMFLWVSLIIDDLQKSITTRPRIIREKLKSLPKNLPGLYTDILLKIKAEDQEYATTILRWVVWAVRPLTLQELTIAIAIRLEDTSISSLESDIESDLSKVLQLLFGPMINIRGDEVHLVHQSAKDFLRAAEFTEGSSHDHLGFLSRLCATESESNLQLVVSCLTYLSFDEFEEGPVDASYSWEKLGTRLQKSRFLYYAATNWSEHMTQINQEMQGKGDLRTAFSRFTASSRKMNLAHQIFAFSHDKLFTQTTPLQIAAHLGSTAFVRDILNGGVDVNAQGGEYGNALLAAACGGNEAVVRLLLDSGADVNSHRGICTKALQAATSKGGEAVFRLLAASGGSEYGNALQAAASKGNEAVVRLLMDSGADVNAQGGKYGNALQAAASKGNEAVVRLLMDSGADVNAQGGKYGNALQAAASSDNEVIVRLLVDSGADVNAQGGEYGNALQAAASLGNEAVVRLFVDNGADVNPQGGCYGNALKAAASSGNEAVVRLLVDSGADVGAQGSRDCNALMVAAFQGNEAIVRLLLDNGADVNAQDGRCGNALQDAASSGNEAVVRLLVDSGADVNAQGGEYGNALQAAALKGNEAVVHLLVDSGADVNAQGGYYGNALQVASWGNEAVVRLLVYHGAAVNAQGGFYGNALYAAASSGNKAVVRLLVDSGADVNAQGGEYGNALHAATLNGYEAVVRLLVDSGADINVLGGIYGNALKAVASSGNEAVVRLLVDSRGDVCWAPARNVSQAGTSALKPPQPGILPAGAVPGWVSTPGIVFF